MLKKQFKKQWAKYIEHDPNLNDNFDKTNSLYDLAKIKKQVNY